MDYEKKYKDALEWARKVMQGKVGFVLDEVLEKFPELKESVDERIRKDIVEAVELHKDFTQERKEYIYAWLEKQGEHEQNLTKVEPKFYEGEWITNGDYTWKIVEVKPLDYILQSQDGNIVDDTISHVDEQFHSFTIEDAKDGDVLASKDGDDILIFRNVEDNISFSSYYNIARKEEHYWSKSRFIPATKEQRDALEKAMADAGYTFDFDKKELKKIEQKKTPIDGEFPYDNPSDTLEGEIENIWRKLSSGDRFSATKEGFREVITHFVNYIKEQDDCAWSKEDDYNYGIIQYVLNSECVGKADKEIAFNWFKSLKERYTWKPSIAQLNALSIVSKGNAPDDIEAIVSLYQDLKKLKE